MADFVSTHEAALIEAAKAKYITLCKEDFAKQKEFFLKRFILDLGERYDEACDLCDQFYEKGKGAPFVGHVATADLFHKLGKPRTATQQKAELKDVDLDANGDMSLVEYLIIHFKCMILNSYFSRKGMEPDVDMSTDGVGLVGVGLRLVTEMYSPPLGLDPELEKMMKDFMISKKEREIAIKEKEAVIAQGGVKAMAVKAELEKLTASNESDLNHLEAKIKASTKKAEVASAKMLTEKEAARAAVEADKRAKGKLGDKGAAFGS